MNVTVPSPHVTVRDDLNVSERLLSAAPRACATPSSAATAVAPIAFVSVTAGTLSTADFSPDNLSSLLARALT